MSDAPTTPSSPPPGWYHAEGDAAGTVRYWDGTAWTTGPQSGPPPPAIVRTGDPILDRIAPPWHRIGARIIDGFIVGIAAFVIVIALVIGTFDADTDDARDIAGPLIAVGLLAVIYEVAFIALKGATPGKMIVGIRVIRQDGTSPPGWQAAILRYLPNAVGAVPARGPISVIAGLLSFGLLVTSLVFLFSDRYRRTVNDRLAKTYVVLRHP